MPLQASRFYHLLLRLYPAQHQREYADHMVQAFNDLYRQKRQKQPNLWAWIGFWLHILSDTIISVTIEHYQTAKEYPMTIRSHPVSLILLPLLAIILTYLLIVHQNIDFAAVYFCVFLTGGIIWAMSKAGLQKHNPLWNAYTKGTFMGSGAVLVMVFSVMAGVDIIFQKGNGWLGFIFVACIYLSTLLLIRQYFKALGKVFWAATVALPAMSAIALWMTFSAMRLEIIHAEIIDYFPISLAFSTLQILVIIAIGALSIHQARKNGHANAISMIVCSGMIYAAFYPNIRYTEVGRMADWLMILFPLVLCPMCWLAIKSPNIRLMATFGLWCLMVLLSELSPMLTTGTFGFYLLRGDTLGNSHLVTTVIPLLVMIWLVLQTSSKKENGAEYLLGGT